MDKHLIINTVNEEHPQIDENCDSSGLHFISIVSVTRDSDGPHIAECDSRDRSAVKQEADDVCYVVCCI